MQTVLVTGGAGFIGGCLVRRLVREGEVRVINYDKLTYAGNLDSLAEVLEQPRHVFIEGDTCDGEKLDQVFSEYRPQAIFHLAAESHVDRSIDGPAEFVRTNVFGTFQMLEAARRYWLKADERERQAFRFINISTDEVYGSLGPSDAFRETTPYAPNSPYSASKASADHFVRAYYHTFHLPTITTNCSNNYGPFQFPEKLIPLMILNAKEGRPLPVYGDGQNIRDWLYVEDHAEALLTVWRQGRPGEVYNIGGESERKNLDVVQTICRLVDEHCPPLPQGPREQLLKFVPDRPGHDRRYAIDISKIRDELGWQPRQSFETGLESTIRWYLEHPLWIERVTSGVYQRERLGLASEKVSS